MPRRVLLRTPAQAQAWPKPKPPAARRAPARPRAACVVRSKQRKQQCACGSERFRKAESGGFFFLFQSGDGGRRLVAAGVGAWAGRRAPPGSADGGRMTSHVGCRARVHCTPHLATTRPEYLLPLGALVYKVALPASASRFPGWGWQVARRTKPALRWVPSFAGHSPTRQQY
jgi:hypothetical protein